MTASTDPVTASTNSNMGTDSKSTLPTASKGILKMKSESNNPNQRNSVTVARNSTTPGGFTESMNILERMKKMEQERVMA